MNQLINIYLSSPHEGKSYKNLGGPPTVPVQDGIFLTHLFEIESLHGGEVFSVLYVRNDTLTATPSDTSAAIAVGIDYTENSDVVREDYLRSLNITIYRPTYVTKNYIHPTITPDGMLINEGQSIKNFIPDIGLNRKVLFIDEILQPGEFISFVVRLTSSKPIPTVFSNKVYFNIFAGVF